MPLFGEPRTCGQSRDATRVAWWTTALCALGHLLVVHSAAAQLIAAPSDSIVRRAVDPARFKDWPIAVLLDEGSYRVEPDGRGVMRTRQVVQVLSAGAVGGLAERAFGYAKAHQTLTVHWVRVLKPNGDVVSDKAAQEQESDIPAAMANPVYQDQRVRRLSLAGIAVGTIVDIAWSLEESAPPRAGDFFLRRTLNSTTPTVQSRFTLDIPAGFSPRIAERNIRVPRTDITADGRRVLTWSAYALQGIRPEPFAADSNDVVMSVTVSAPGSWSDLARWYDGLARDRYVVNADVARRVDSLVRASNARSRLDTIRAVHRWVTQDVRYVSVSLGIAGYQPRSPSEVLRTGFGDCKDKATLFVATLRRYRIDASPVLLALGGRPDRSMPSIFQFNHAIAAVRDGAGWTYTDLTADAVPYGEIPDAYQGALGVVVNADGSAQEITFPVSPIDANASELSVSLSIDTAGRVLGHVTERARGVGSYPLRMAFATPLDSLRRETLSKGLALRFFPSDATVDSVVTSSGRDFTVPVQMSYRLNAEGTLKVVGDTRLFALSPTLRGVARSFRNLARDLEARPVRVFPIDAAQLLASSVAVTDVRITLPIGWKAELPKNVSATAFFGSYESTWTQEGREVHLVRRIRGGRGYYLPQRIVEVVAWLKAVGVDDYEFLSLHPATTMK